MSVQVEKLEKNMAKLTIEVAAEDFVKAVEAAYQKNKNSINVPEEFANRLIKVAKVARSKSSNSYDYKKVKRPYQRHDRTSDVRVWDVQHKEHTAYFTINEEHPLVKKYTEGLHEAKKRALFSLLIKEFPIQELSSGITARPEYSDDELYAMLLDSYEIKRKQLNMTYH